MDGSSSEIPRTGREEFTVGDLGNLDLVALSLVQNVNDVDEAIQPAIS